MTLHDVFFLVSVKCKLINRSFFHDFEFRVILLQDCFTILGPRLRCYLTHNTEEKTWDFSNS